MAGQLFQKLEKLSDTTPLILTSKRSEGRGFHYKYMQSRSVLYIVMVIIWHSQMSVFGQDTHIDATAI